MVTGIGSVNGGAVRRRARARASCMAYDATVLAGTQGMRNHQKTDRLLGIALEQQLPVVLFAEGGGGRPGDTDMPIVAGLHVPTFASFARLNGQVPVVGIVAGRCFAGNAALLGCCDVIIATRGSNIGMGGPAMVEGGGLGVFRPSRSARRRCSTRNGVIDVLVDDEAAGGGGGAAATSSIFQGRARATGTRPTARALRDVVPENRLRVYDSRARDARASPTPARCSSCAPASASASTPRWRASRAGRSACSPTTRLHLGGAIDADAADKAARFMQLCDAHGLPLVTLVDTPGFMVGPEIEEAGAGAPRQPHVRRRRAPARAVLRVVLRKGYGLGAMAMAAGGFHAPLSTVAWPSGEFGAMGLEGAVRLGYRKELEALPEGPERDALLRAPGRRSSTRKGRRSTWRRRWRSTP